MKHKAVSTVYQATAGEFQASHSDAEIIPGSPSKPDKPKPNTAPRLIPTPNWAVEINAKCPHMRHTGP